MSTEILCKSDHFLGIEANENGCFLLEYCVCLVVSPRSEYILMIFDLWSCFLIFFNKKIAYRLKTAGHILLVLCGNVSSLVLKVE